MIRIFNKQEDFDIIFHQPSDWIQFTPKDFEEKPFVTIELKGFDFNAHSLKCKDCAGFINAIGTDSLHWKISYSGKIFRLDMRTFGNSGYGENELKTTMSDYNPGTKMTLKFHDIPIDKVDLLKMELDFVENEDYEKACVIRDLLKNNLK